MEEWSWGKGEDFVVGFDKELGEVCPAAGRVHCLFRISLAPPIYLWDGGTGKKVKIPCMAPSEYSTDTQAALQPSSHNPCPAAHPNVSAHAPSLQSISPYPHSEPTQ